VGGPFDWSFTPPASAALGDHDVPLLSSHLKGKRIALLVGAGIAAMKAPLLARALRRRGAQVTAFCSPEALRYVGLEALEWACEQPVIRDLSWRAEHLSEFGNAVRDAIEPQHPDAAERLAQIMA
jgi:phosphopantothenoylcysteine decarboxylase/phosphopantothenate--cysteine ligase